MSVNRYDSDAGYMVYASDYDELNAKYERALFVLEYERENRMIERDAAKELRERVAWMLECEDTQMWVMSDCPLPSDDNWSEIGESYIAARKAVEELL